MKMSEFAFEGSFNESNEKEVVESVEVQKFVVTIDKGDKAYTGSEQRYAMNFFENEAEVLDYVSDLSKGHNNHHKVHKLFTIDYVGKSKNKTIKFIDGQLKVIDAPIQEGL
jgi:hypothetical protein